MIALDRQGWILVGFAVLFFTALVVSACGWLLIWRGRRSHPIEEPVAPDAGDDGSHDVQPEPEPELEEPEVPEAVAEETPLPPGNPLR